MPPKGPLEFRAFRISGLGPKPSCGPIYTSSIIPGSMCGENERPFQPLSNLKQPIPLGRKLRLLASNNLKKLVTRRSCCGNYSQPGC